MCCVVRARERWFPLYVSNVGAWLPFNAVIYGFAPIDLRVTALTFCTVVYTAFLSFFSEREATMKNTMKAKSTKL